ncbi:MAG TPA: NADH-quinone oxidoreductase subunit C [Gaiellaceae bacterium]|nr:NADH-quinone oxidoreductase subunit C [Gaiellaceae bacterium]
MNDYRDRIRDALDSGGTFAGLYAVARGGPVRVALTDESGTVHVETVEPRSGVVQSIVDLAPTAAWDEREAHDLYGVRFEGHEPLRPLVDHDQEIGSWTVPVEGRDPYQVAVGPIHAGVIESGHFRFHVVGERILHLDARLFYKHRGLERSAEGASLEDGLAVVSRACAACAVTNGVAYAQAAEKALGARSSAELARARTILLELERIWSHLNDISAVCAGTGLAAGAQRFAGLTERARRLNARLTGHRFLFGTVRVGGSDLTLDSETMSDAREELESLRAESSSAWRELVFNRSFDDRLVDVGIVRAKDVRRLGATGPAARAAGVPVDARAVSPALAYDDFVPVTPIRATGDVKSRLEQRHLELVQSFELLEALLTKPVRPCSTESGAPEHPIAASRVESPRGATLCVAERDGGRLTRVHLRTGSYANWPVVAFAAVGNMLADFPLINKSFELCYACADR